VSDFKAKGSDFKSMKDFIDYVVQCFNSDEGLPNIASDMVEIRKYNDDKDDSLFGSYMIEVKGFGTFGFMTKESYDHLNKDKAAGDEL